MTMRTMGRMADNIRPSLYNAQYTVEVANKPNEEEILKPDVEIKNKKDILIYHTHTCESYTPSERI